MKKVKFNLENCYGIAKFVETLDFNKKDKKGENINAHLIYAPNGTMKTSFADTIKDIQNDRETIDYYYPDRETVREVHEVLEDGTESKLEKDDVFVIDSYDAQYKSDKISTLLVNKALKKEYDKIYTALLDKLERLYTILRSECGMRNNIDIMLTEDFGFDKDKILECLYKISSTYKDYDYKSLEGLKYNKVFNNDTEKIYRSDIFKTLITEYINCYEKLLIKNPVFKKEFNHTSADNVLNNMKNNGFFAANHKVVLDGANLQLDEKEFEKEIEDAKKLILNEPEMMSKFERIDGLFTNAKTREFRDILLNKKHVILELADIDEFKRKLWVTYLFKDKDFFDDLISSYKTGREDLKALAIKAAKERTAWDDVIKKYNERFTNMPFTLEIENYSDVILKESIETVSFKYNDRNEEKELDKESLIKRLSNGEKRALYLLNIIFEIEAKIIEGRKTLLVIDDIADSFDYKNKYAIIEYLKDIVECGVFKVIILTHNFDFYRTVASRINLQSTSHFILKGEDEIILEKGEYHKNAFIHWKSQIYNKNVFFISAITFIRNIIEYTKGYKCLEYKVLTSLLHIKEDPTNENLSTRKIAVKDLKKIYIENWGTENKFTQSDDDLVFDLILKEAELIYTKNVDPIKIENKIVLSIAIRLLAEEYMIERISDKDAIERIKNCQTRELRDLIQFDRNDKEDVQREEIIERVLIITSENIHINSFMYEPIVDISLDELRKLYGDVKKI